MRFKFATFFACTLLSFSTFGQLDFKNPVFVEDQGDPTKLIFGDFDGNGIKDVGYTIEPFGQLKILYNYGSSQAFERKIQVAKRTSSLFTVEVGDFNGDAKDDLVFVDYSATGADKERLVVLISTGNDFVLRRLAFDSVDFNSIGILLLDFDGNGKLDMLAASNGRPFTLFKGDGTGNFLPEVVSGVIPMGHIFKEGDLNRDGLMDFVFVSPQQMDIFLKNSSGSGYISSTKTFDGFFPTGLTIGDFSGDGFLDIVTSLLSYSNGNNGALLEFKNVGNGSFGSGLNIPTRLAPFVGLGSTDFNKDGRLDLVFGAFNGRDANVVL
jgi:hypothetical protein